MRIIKELTQTCEACPSQWEGTFDDGTEVYIRYRWGFLSVSNGVSGEQLFADQLGDSLDGVLSTEKLRRVLAHHFILPNSVPFK